LFTDETPAQRQLRVCGCWMSDCGAHDHPEYRAEQSFTRVLRAPGVAFSHPARGFLALTLAMRYEAELDQPFLQSARRLLDPSSLRRAEVLGLSLRLAYVLCAGTPQLLAGTSLKLEGGRLILRLTGQSFAFNVESVTRRLDRLAQAAGLAPEIEGVSE
jgi:exopolyphosphatase/guanosine-5'-triphosphate,3'-diphosphate pyrophosphatase